MITPALSSALAGLQLYRQRVDRAAQTIAAAGVDEPAAPVSSEPGSTATAATADDLTGALTTMLIAQRAFAAQIRVIETANDMARESLSLTDGSRERQARERTRLPA